MPKISLFKFVQIVYENDTTSQTDSSTHTPATNTESGDRTKTTENSGANGENKRTYTDAEVQKLIESERKRNADQTRTTIQNLETLRQNQQLSEQEKASLSKQIEDLNKSLLSKEELAKRERDRLVNEHKSTLDNISKERDTWKSRFEESQITRAIVDAAIKGDAFNANLIVPLLKPNAALVENQNDGQPTGTFAVKVNMTVFEGGVAKSLTLSPEEAIKLMKDKPDEYGNLFKGNLNGGVGGGASPRNQNNVKLDTTNHEEYLRNREFILGRTQKKS